MKNFNSENTVKTVEVYNYTSCTSNGGDVKTSDNDKAGWIKMRNTSDGVWEANVVPTDEIPDEFIRLNGETIATISSSLEKLESGKAYSLTIITHKEGITLTVIDLSTLTENYTIKDDGNYYFIGTTTSHSINVTGYSPQIYLDEVNIGVSGSSAISITGNATPTIYVLGTNTVKSTDKWKKGAGIYVAAGSTVTIEGYNGRDSDILTAVGENAAGIGSLGNNKGGNIIIKNVTVYAQVDEDSQTTSASGIGYGSWGGGSITIENATVEARGKTAAPAIGAAGSTAPTITISDSTVKAYRGLGSSSDIVDWIGEIKNSGTAGINATITNTTVEEYTIKFYYRDEVTEDGSVTYDANGNET